MHIIFGTSLRHKEWQQESVLSKVSLFEGEAAVSEPVEDNLSAQRECEAQSSL